MSTTRLFTSCFYVSATAFDPLCRWGLALCQNANYTLLTGAQCYVPLLPVDRAKGVHDFNSLIYCTALASGGWLGVNAFPRWRSDLKTKMLIKANPAGLIFCARGGTRGADYCTTMKRRLGFSKSWEPICCYCSYTWLDSPKHGGNLWQVKSCDSPAVPAMWSLKLAGKWGGEKELMQNSHLCQKTGGLNTSHLVLTSQWVKMNILTEE